MCTKNEVPVRVPRRRSGGRAGVGGRGAAPDRHAADAAAAARLLLIGQRGRADVGRARGRSTARCWGVVAAGDRVGGRRWRRRRCREDEEDREDLGGALAGARGRRCFGRAEGVGGAGAGGGVRHRWAGVRRLWDRLRRPRPARVRGRRGAFARGSGAGGGRGRRRRLGGEGGAQLGAGGGEQGLVLGAAGAAGLVDLQPLALLARQRGVEAVGEQQLGALAAGAGGERGAAAAQGLAGALGGEAQRGVVEAGVGRGGGAAGVGELEQGERPGARRRRAPGAARRRAVRLGREALVRAGRRSAWARGRVYAAVLHSWKDPKDDREYTQKEHWHGADHRRHRTRLRGRHHRGPHPLPRVGRRRLGRPLLAPARVHAGVHHRAGLHGVDQARVRPPRREDPRPVDRPGRGQPEVGRGHRRDPGDRAQLPDHRRHRPRGRQGLRDAAGRRRGRPDRAHRGPERHAAQRLRRRARQEDQARADLPDDHRPQLRRGPARHRLAQAHRRAPGRHPGAVAARRRRDHRRLGHPTTRPRSATPRAGTSPSPGCASSRRPSRASSRTSRSARIRAVAPQIRSSPTT